MVEESRGEEDETVDEMAEARVEKTVQSRGEEVDVAEVEVEEAIRSKRELDMEEAMGETV